MPNSAPVKPNTSKKASLPKKLVKLPAKLKNPRVALLAALGLIVAAGVALSLIANYWVNGHSLIYSEVYANGINVSGLTVEQATELLNTELMEDWLDQSLGLTIDDKSVSITAEDAGITVAAGKIAQKAYDVGRQGGFFTRLNYVMSETGTRNDIEIGKDLVIDSENVNRIVSALVMSVNKEPIQHTSNLTDTSLELKTGSAGRHVDLEEVLRQVDEKLSVFDFTPIKIKSARLDPDPVPLKALLNEIYIAPKNARFELENNRKLGKIHPHVVGVGFDMDAAKKALKKENATTSIPIVETIPEVTSTALEENLFREKLGSGSQTSTATSSASRAGNISLASSLINGVIVLPGERFSFNDVVGQRTVARGFREAGVFLDGVPDVDIGGGICQVSSTLYNAVLLANLDIVSRQNHSLPISYLPLGLDAAVSWGGPEFIFSNNTNYPIKIKSSHENRKLSISITGTNIHGQSVRMERNALAARKVQTFRVVLDSSGNMISRTPEALSTYKSPPTPIPKPTKKPDDPEEDNPKPTAKPKKNTGAKKPKAASKPKQKPKQKNKPKKPKATPKPKNKPTPTSAPPPASTVVP
ncbi:MAG: VanW family protein [Oscillospiraceae bacterium]|nr:VanW family protein [Oscillospiraceae bacterium]